MIKLKDILKENIYEIGDAGMRIRPWRFDGAKSNYRSAKEFKDFVAYGRGIKKGLSLGIKYYARTTQFFTVGLFIKLKGMFSGQ